MAEDAAAEYDVEAPRHAASADAAAEPVAVHQFLPEQQLEADAAEDAGNIVEPPEPQIATPMADAGTPEAEQAMDFPSSSHAAPDDAMPVVAEQSVPPHAAAAPPVIPQPRSADPLAAMKALSAEELIALFT